MGTFREADHPRGDGDGRFTEKAQADPGSDVLGGSPAGDSTLDLALARYGLTADHVPGLAEAWQEAFVALEQPRPDTVEEAGRDILGNPNWGRYRGGPWLEVIDSNAAGGTREIDLATLTDTDELVLRVHTRNGAGNREHDDHAPDEFRTSCTACATERLQRHPLYWTDEDDTFDATYADFWFRVPPENRAEMLRAADYDRVARRWDMVNQRRQAILDGTEAPWSLMASGADLDDHQKAVNDTNRAVLDTWNADRHNQTIRQAKAFLAVADGKPVGNDPISYIEVNDPSDRMWGGTRRVHLSQLGELAEKAADAEVRDAKYARIQAEIDAGTVSPELRDYLVGERPQQTYKVVEGTGRNKRTVTRTHTPRSDFVKEAEKAAADAARYPVELAETRRRIQERLDASRQALQASDQAKARLARLADEKWALGWPGDPADVPPRPATITDPEDFQ